MNLASILLIMWFIFAGVFMLIDVIFSDYDSATCAGKICGFMTKIALLSTLIYYSGGWN